MLKSLTDQFQGIFSRLAGKKSLTEENIADAVRDVRMALLEADVNYSVVKTLIKRIKEKSVGLEAVKGVSPSQQFIKCVHEELKELMGGEESALNLKGSPAVILLAGLQGSGKTTQAAKLALWLKKNEKKRPLLVACDLKRPAAVHQLETLAKQAECAFFKIEGESDPVRVAKEALLFAKREGCDVVILDTAGRLHIDDELMEELERVKSATAPDEVLFVVNATIGQDAVNVAEAFDKRVAITGTILTMLDGNTRGGAAISVKEVTGRPLKFEGVGETLTDLQIFNPQSMADRILGMGDTINLVKKAKEHIDEEEAKSLEEKLKKASFTYGDYLKQIRSVRKMGSFKSLLGMLPGMGQLKDLDFNEKELFKVEAIILSMTEKERREAVELIPSRRRRVARGSGTTIDDVNRLAKSFKNAKQFFKNMPNMKELQKMFGG